jgi:hypothetical protein
MMPPSKKPRLKLPPALPSCKQCNRAFTPRVDRDIGDGLYCDTCTRHMEYWALERELISYCDIEY